MYLRKLWIIALALLISAPVFAQWNWDENDDIPITRDEMRRRAERKYISNNSAEMFRYDDDARIDKGEIIDGNVVVSNGDLNVYGEIDGDVLVIFGDVFVRDNALVTGNITSVGGRIKQYRESRIKGNQIETSPRNLFRNVNFDLGSGDSWHWTRSKNYSTLPLWPLEDRFLFAYNRVQGIFLGMELPKSISRKSSIATFHGFVGYGFKEKAVRYEAGLDRHFFDRRDYRFELGGKVYDLTDSHDDWVITPHENTLAALLIHEDFRDYFRRNGFELHVSQNYTVFLKGTVAWRNERYTSLSKNADWAIFGGDKKFRDNPVINEGNLRSVYGELYYDTRDDHDAPRRGWYAKISGEFSNSKLNSDFSFNQYLFELRRYQPLSRSERIDIRIKAGSADGILPWQKRYELGGLSTLRGFRFKEFAGDRMLLANIEYVLSPSTFNQDLLFFDDLRLILFTDIGAAWYSNDTGKWTKGFEHLKFNTLKSDFGVAISDWDGIVRLNIAKRTDTNRKPLEISFRIAKPF